MVSNKNTLGSDLISGCRQNERYLLHMLRLKQRESKANLARQTGLTAAAVGGLIKSLQEKGLVKNVGKVQGDMGQPATLFSLAKNGAYGLGVSINRGHIETILINFVGEVVASNKHQIILPSPKEALALISSDIRALVESVADNISGRITGVGVAMPYNIGSADSDNPEWMAWQGFDICQALRDEFVLPVHRQNDANAAAIAERIYGKSAESNDFAYLFFGSSMVQSFGGGLILDGNCWNGVSGNAGDFGLLPVPAGKVIDEIDPSGDVSTYLTNRCSLFSLVKYLRFKGSDINDIRDFHQAIADDPVSVGRWITDAVDALTVATQSLQAVVDVPEIIIDCEDVDLPLVARIINGLQLKMSHSPHAGMVMPTIRKGSFGSDASAIGAATLPLDSSFSPQSMHK